MALSSGTRLGPYEILAAIGAGGMGEVYRARDSRLSRQVAIKILPAIFSSDPDRLRRFQQEATAAAALNDPGILAVYDVGMQDGFPYLVAELLEGETLRDRLRSGALSRRKSVEYGVQIARALAAAHDKGILHRDLKPENIFITHEGRIKIFDFGLAKLMRPKEAVVAAGQTTAPTATVDTTPGVVVGTVGYMSPEQVRGLNADGRSDIFALGAVLYEMLSGQRAFKGDTPADTMSAILNEDPPELAEAARDISPALERIVRHCLEKQPDERFQSAHDVAFALDTMSLVSSTVMPPAKVLGRRRWMRAATLAAALLLAIALGALLARRGVPPQPIYKRLTFQRGVIQTARFAPDGQSVVYSAAWQGNPSELFATVGKSSDSRALGILNTQLLAVSPSGELALATNIGLVHVGGIRTLSRVPLGGGLPREVLDRVVAADWGPDGNFAVVRESGGRNRLEYPIGHLLYESSGAITDIRFSRDGKRIAFLDHPQHGDSAGTIAVVDMSGRKKTISPAWTDEHGLAWSLDDHEVWYTASQLGVGAALYASSLSGHTRLVLRVPGALNLHDIAPDGRVLLTQGRTRWGILLFGPGANEQRDLSWLDYTFGRDLSADGKLALFDEEGEGASSGYAVYVRNTDGSPAMRLADGGAMAFSPDGKWTLAFINPASSQAQPVLLPLGAGEPVKIPVDNLSYSHAAFLPDSKRLLLLATEPGHGPRLYVQDITSGERKPVSEEGVIVGLFGVGIKCISPDGNFVALLSADRRWMMYPVEGGEPRPIKGLSDREAPVRFTADGRSLFVYSRDEHGIRKIERFEIATGRRVPWPSPTTDMSGILGFYPVQLTPDGKVALYNYGRVLEDLYVVSGLK